VVNGIWPFTAIGFANLRKVMLLSSISKMGAILKIAGEFVFHLIGLVFWLGSLLILTHVLGIHSDEPSAEAHAALGRLEMKLFKGLAHPGAALMVITGIILVTRNPEYLREFWLRAKLLLVVVLILLDFRVYLRTRAFLAGRMELERSECMAWHGAIALVFFAILIFVLVKPFGPRARTGLLHPPGPGMASFVKVAVGRGERPFAPTASQQR